MTPPADQPSSAQTAQVAAPESVTAGQLLRAARVQAGVHLAVLSVTLKVPVRQLEALEAGQLDLSKGPVFYRALAASMCRHLQTDPAPVLALLPASARHLEPLRTDPLLAVPERKLHSQASMAWSRRPSRVFLAAAFMLLLAGALLWLPGPSHWPWLEDVKALLAQEGAVAQVDEHITPSTVYLPGVSEGPATDTSVTTGSAPTVTAAATPAPATPADLANAQTGEWVFTAREECWLELRNAQKNVVWSGVLQPGSITRIVSPVPVSVVVGRAPVVTVTWRGQPFDLKPHTQVTVARFEVKE
jgi:cytoskeleton protein RodZ